MSNLPQSLIAAAAGGALGASCRLLFITAIKGGAAGILIINVAGALALGFALPLLAGRSELWTAFLGAGFLGGLTTFSAYAGVLVQLFEESPVEAVLYVLASTILGAAAFLLGGALARGVA